MTARTVWLASYPKSGNTWVRALLAALQREEGELDINALGHGPIASARLPLEDATGLSSSELTMAEAAALRPEVDAEMNSRFTAVRYRKIHDNLRWGPGGPPIVPLGATRAAVYIVRDPRDIAVSLAHHNDRPIPWAVRKLCRATFRPVPSFSHVGPQFPQYTGSWGDHVRSWTRDPPFPVEVVRYEDLHVEPEGQLRRIAALGELEVTDAQIRAAVDAARFDRLRAQEEREDFGERVGSERFFRRGAAGGWREELEPDLAAEILAAHAETMAELGYR